MRRLAGLSCLLTLAVGCGADARYASRQTSEAAAGAAPAAKEAGGEDSAAVRFRSAAGEGFKPRIIYSADVTLVAEDFAVAEERVTKLVADVGGYLASAREDRTSGSSRYGQWSVRVPVDKFESFLASLDAIGFVESRNQTSEDVTMEYVDVEARIANLKRLEERYVTLLAESAGDLEEVLKVEQELARVRGEIEQSEGRLRFLTNKTDFSTVTVLIREQKDYVPPKAPSFGERIASTWGESLAALKRAGELAVLAAVALLPWAAAALVPVLAVAATVRLAMRRRRLTQG